MANLKFDKEITALLVIDGDRRLDLLSLNRRNKPIMKCRTENKEKEEQS
jgi:hypothetical protein